MTDSDGGTTRAGWATVGLPLVLASLVLVSVVAFLVVDQRGRAGPPPSTTSAAGSTVPSPELAGEWSGEAALTGCAGFDQEDCPAVLPLTLHIDCSGKRCVVTPFDRTYGSPPVRIEDGSYRAVGPVPSEAAPTCGGTPTSSASWRVEFTVADGGLRGSYTESTIQGFDCGATSVAWAFRLERR